MKRKLKRSPDILMFELTKNFKWRHRDSRQTPSGEFTGWDAEVHEDTAQSLSSIYWEIRSLIKHSPLLLMAQFGSYEKSQRRIEELVSHAIAEGLKDGADCNELCPETYLDVSFWDVPRKAHDDRTN